VLDSFERLPTEFLISSRDKCIAIGDKYSSLSCNIVHNLQVWTGRELHKCCPTAVPCLSIRGGLWGNHIWTSLPFLLLPLNVVRLLKPRPRTPLMVNSKSKTLDTCFPVEGVDRSPQALFSRRKLRLLAFYFSLVDGWRPKLGRMICLAAGLFIIVWNLRSLHWVIGDATPFITLGPWEAHDTVGEAVLRGIVSLWRAESNKLVQKVFTTRKKVRKLIGPNSVIVIPCQSLRHNLYTL
jgi:hypothetical protein